MTGHLHLIIRQLTPDLFAYHQKLLGFCREAYGIKPE